MKGAASNEKSTILPLFATRLPLRSQDQYLFQVLLLPLSLPLASAAADAAATYILSLSMEDWRDTSPCFVKSITFSLIHRVRHGHEHFEFRRVQKVVPICIGLNEN